MFDRGTEFMAEFSNMCQDDYGLKRKPITTRNPQYNAIIERIHQTIGNIIRTFDVSNIINNDPWSGILAVTVFAVRATYNTTLQASTMQLVFGQDNILNIKQPVRGGKGGWNGCLCKVMGSCSFPDLHHHAPDTQIGFFPRVP